jgi:hypothetical protein
MYVYILSGVKDGDSRLPRRCGVRLRAGSCFTARYRSYLRSHRRSSGLRDTDRRVHIPVEDGPTRATHPLADAEGLAAVLKTSFPLA